MQYPLSQSISIPDQNLQVNNSGFIAYEIMIFKSVIKETNDHVISLIDNGPLAIDAGRHPILEGIHNDFVVCYDLVIRYLMALLKLFLILKPV